MRNFKFNIYLMLQSLVWGTLFENSFFFFQVIFFTTELKMLWGAQMMVREALNSALDEEMSADPKVFLMGEEVGKSVLGFSFSWSKP